MSDRREKINCVFPPAFDSPAFCPYNCPVKLRLFIVGLSLTTLTTFADTNVITAGNWIVDGAVDPSPDAREVNLVVDKVPVGTASELKVFYNFDGTNAMQIFSLKGSGVIQPSLPPPGEPGGLFLLTGYWDCDTGFMGSMAITDLEFRTKGGGKTFIVRGKISNGDSLEAKDLQLKFSPPATNSISVEVQYRLKALRDICVDRTHHDAQEEFQVARMFSNFVSSETNQNDRLRLVKLDDRFCNPYSGCHVKKSSLCRDLVNADGYLFGSPRRLGKPALVLLHRTRLPRETPTLAIDFLSPSHNRIKAQGYTTQTNDPTALNVSIWGNWRSVKKGFKEGRTVRRFRYRLEARDPNDTSCDQVTEPPQ